MCSVEYGVCFSVVECAVLGAGVVLSAVCVSVLWSAQCRLV